jgi:hypothetical protein
LAALVKMKFLEDVKSLKDKESGRMDWGLGVVHLRKREWLVKFFGEKRDLGNFRNI